MIKDLYGGKDWVKLWSKLEQQGNVGLDYCINPVLYPKLCNKLNATENAIVVDFGAGTNIMAIQFLFGYKENIPALLRCKKLDDARQNIKKIIGIEQSPSLVKEAKKYHRDLSYPNSIDINRMNLIKGHKLPLKSKSVDLATSRNFLMHLSVEDLDFHLSEVYRILDTHGSYIFAVLNPDYELQKYNSDTGKSLRDNQRYKFQHGAVGENGVFYHYYKTKDHYESLFKKNFKITKITPCTPISNEFKKSHPRYYWKKNPMAYVYELTKRT